MRIEERGLCGAELLIARAHFLQVCMVMIARRSR